MTTLTARDESFRLDGRELDARLSALPGNHNNSLMDDSWSFIDHNKYLHNINFNETLALSRAYPEWKHLRGVNSVLLVKGLWTLLAEHLTISTYPLIFRNLMLWMWAMAEHNADVITRENLPNLIKFVLTHTWSREGPVPSRVLKGKLTLQRPTLQNLKTVCEEMGLPLISRKISEAQVSATLKTLIPEIADGELTYQDWRQGKSFNLLTLDHGRYYVEHCLNFFEEHAPLAIALRQTQQELPKIAKKLKIKPQTLKAILPRILEGNSPEEFSSLSPRYIRRIQPVVLKHFWSLHRQTRFECKLLEEDILREIAFKFRLAASPDNVDRLRVVIWNWLQTRDQKETQRLLHGCHEDVSWSSFLEALNEVKQRCDDMPNFSPTVAFFKSFDLQPEGAVHETKANKRGLLGQFINRVAKAGLTNVAALTGWRKSEFGFPFKAIQQTHNKDKLDEYAFPHRYQIDWYVHKTNGQVRELREVTFSTITLIERLKRLNCTGENQPCLYSTKSSKRNQFDSSIAVNIAVTALWPHFVFKYPGFEAIDDWKSWQTLTQIEASGNVLTMAQHQERERLLKIKGAAEWNSFTVDENLQEARRQVREQWPMLSFAWTKNSEASDWVLQYRHGVLRSDWAALLDTQLSDETKTWLSSLSDKECKSNAVVGRVLMNELLAEALYPSPHAFRHMWAEAIYRRFDGDAGWMIRSQFKHISRTMWLSYIRNKDNRAGHQRAKLRVIHSLVRNYIQHHGEGYAGQMNKLLRRLSRSTQVLSSEQQMELADQLATKEIENIKANPWGYCLLMRRTRHKAKCAEGGEPMRHNASPELCLGCLHNFMQTQNVEWMLLTIIHHVEALNDPVVPGIFKHSSYELVSNTARHLRTLNATHEALPELETALENYRLRAA
ncbi:hypothetical protein [uncultured Marinobacter sp.]|uniref:hypothetical protein n=1 Tax=uncultured Marinobacter sp. TaxID=187379 RepID=UPI0030D8FAA6|tara:strand:- start:1646 stop:4330 length:2685 start_codon:yes stop_codon:yes gene_type:complete